MTANTTICAGGNHDRFYRSQSEAAEQAPLYQGCAESSATDGLIYVLVSLIFRAHSSGKRILHVTGGVVNDGRSGQKHTQQEKEVCL
jgi:hypothetical protein